MPNGKKLNQRKLKKWNEVVKEWKMPLKKIGVVPVWAKWIIRNLPKALNIIQILRKSIESIKAIILKKKKKRMSK